jgi:hypothetical protein
LDNEDVLILLIYQQCVFHGDVGSGSRTGSFCWAAILQHSGSERAFRAKPVYNYEYVSA